MSHPVFAALNRAQYQQLVKTFMTIDPHGIYAQRRSLARFIPCDVWRGIEWWHGAAH